MAFIIPPYVSAILGVGLPGHGTFATPFVVTAPRRFRSTNSEYSIPEPNVPDATVIGFFHSTPAMFTAIFTLLITVPPPQHKRQDHLHKSLHCVPLNAHPHSLSDRHRQDRRLHHMPSFLPMKSHNGYSALPHTV